MALRSYFMERERLEQIYRRARYRVELAGGAIELGIGERSPALDRHLESVGVSSWAVVTACNPGSRRLGAEENRRRTAELARRLSDAEWSTRPAAGLDPDAIWPAEPGFLVLGAPLEALRELAADFGQGAIVAARRGEAARLLWIGSVPQAPPEEAL